jgi:tripartite-type tricarboxylate transporter receptor subunit TctC
VLGLPSTVSAQSVEDFYRGKTIQVMIGYGVGGTDDTWARLIARFLPDHMPGHPTAVPTNVPGAGSLLLANQIVNTQPKDGTVIGLINRGMPFEPLLSGPGVRFDSRKLNFLGSPDLDTLVCVARNDAPAQTLDDLKTKELIVGSTGSGADSQTYPEVLANLLGLKLKIVQGYPGSRDILLAVERGEVQGGCVSYDTVARDAYFVAKKSHLIFQAAIQSDPRIPDVPVATDLAGTDDQKKALRLFFERTRMGRPFIAAPGVPNDRVAALRAGFKASMEDPALLEEAKKIHINPRYVSPDELQKVISEAYEATPETIALTKKAFGR